MLQKIETFDDLLNIINTHPEWRRQLVKALFPEIDLPKALQELIESNRLMRAELAEIKERIGRVEERQERMEERQERMEERQERMEERQERMEERMGRMEVRQDGMDRRLESIDGRLTRVEGSVGELKGSSYERDIRDKANAIFGYFLRRGRDIKNELSQQLDDAEDGGLISEEEYTQVMAADLLWGGRVKQIQENATLVVEVSWYAEDHDLERAIQRASILQKLGLRSFPVVAAVEWPPDMRENALAEKIVVVDRFNLDRQSWQSAL